MTELRAQNGQIPPHYALALLVLLTILGRHDPETAAALATATTTLLPYIQGTEPRA